jgi:hypothetical protein
VHGGRQDDRHAAGQLAAVRHAPYPTDESGRRRRSDPSRRTATAAKEVADWLTAEYGIGHGHAMAMVHVIRKGAYIGDKHVGSTGSHRDESDTLWLDGKATRPAP